MSSICIHEKACVDVMDIGGSYVASIWLYGTQHQLGPYDTREAMMVAVQHYLSDLRLIAEIKEFISITNG